MCCTQSVSQEQPKRPSTVCGRFSATLRMNSEAVERRLRSQLGSCWREVQKRCKQADNGKTGEMDLQTFLGWVKMLLLTKTALVKHCSFLKHLKSSIYTYVFMYPE